MGSGGEAAEAAAEKAAELADAEGPAGAADVSLDEVLEGEPAIAPSDTAHDAR